MRDVPEATRVDAAEKARLLREIFDRLPPLMGYWDRDLRNVLANRAYLDWFGIEPETMAGMHIRDVIGADAFELNEQYMRDALDGLPQRFERTLIDHGGAVRHAQTAYLPDLVDGEVRGFFVLGQDVTARVEAQRELAEAQRLAGVGSWSWTPDVGVLQWSDQMYRIFGQDPASFTPSVDAVAQLVVPDDREEALTRAERLRTVGTTDELTYRIARPDGEIRHVLSRTSSAQQADGAVVTLHGTVQDVTEQFLAGRELAELNERLDAANRVQTDMLAMLGHDARDHVSTVRGSLDLVATQWDALPEDVRIDFVRRAGRGVRRLQELLDDVLTMMGAESGAVEARTQRVAVLENVRAAVGASSHADAVEVTGDPQAVAAVDPFHLRQIVLNLAGNAIKYGRPPVTVTVATRGERAVVSVSDQGEGVPDDFTPRLFERFARATTGVAATKQGTGFGLYIVRELARVNGGEVTYRANEPCGSVFELSLPLIPAADR